MTERHFTLDYVERVELRDGSAVRLRLLAPEDRELLRRGFERLSDESRYSRFLSPKRALTDAELDYLTKIDHEQHFALAAMREEGDGTGEAVGLGIARFIRFADDPTRAEAAIAVADEVQGQGLGKLMFVRLVAAATERGIRSFHCDLLGSNESMRQLIRGVCADPTVDVSQGVVSIDLDLPGVSPTEPTEPTAHAVAESAMYRLFKLAAQNAVDWTAAVRRFWFGGE